ncbi:unnamed protein product [Parnassius apollo]|uniref:(apollo) hypothetical protein n=1 Tax=Parnassius apollo TaxID=110799 RepID=A0A8S3WLR7_PARAO|nr:unnamed protein product [Parnassius apollo]
MVEFNCTYRKALKVYVPPSASLLGKDSFRQQSDNPPTNMISQTKSRFQERDTSTFAEIVKTDISLHKEDVNEVKTLLPILQ